jgi:hypothetical protein
MTSKINLSKNALPVNTRDIVIERLVTYYRTSGCDRYGQLGTISSAAIAKNDEEMDVLRTIVQTATYGYTYGTYSGFQPWGSFIDAEIESLCQKAFAQNRSRNNMNNW